jgi:hypothetical protein
MTALEWVRGPGGSSELAAGDDWTYLITHDDRGMVLTRWEGYADISDADVARQAALYAIRIDGALEVVPEAAIALAAHMRSAAQQYESGLDVTGQPAWWHGYAIPQETGETT